MKSNKLKTPSELIAEDMAKLGYTQRQLAEAMGVDFAVISRIVNGRLSVTVKTAQKLSEVTGRNGWEYIQAQAWKLWTAADQS